MTGIIATFYLTNDEPISRPGASAAAGERPQKRTNLVGDLASRQALAVRRRWRPKLDRPPAIGSAARVHLRPAMDEAILEDKVVRRGAQIPQ